MTYNCLIIDDNIIERDLLEFFLSKISKFNIIATCSNAQEAIDILHANNVDIVYTDIDMGEISGISLLKSLKNPPVFVFVTAYKEYAVESFEIDAFDFIVKPISSSRILKSANKVLDYLDLKAKSINRDSIEMPTNTNTHFYVRENQGMTRIAYDEVIYMESLGDFTTIYTNTNKHITLVNLKNMIAQIPEKLFRRIHKQFIININAIKSINNTHVLMTNQIEVPISQNLKQEFLDSYIDNNTISRFKK